MKQDKKRKIMIIVIVALVVVLSGVGVYFYQFYGATTGLIRQCPDHRVQNNMHMVGPSSADEYLIINDQRKETKDYDMNWINSHCSAAVEVVY